MSCTPYDATTDEAVLAHEANALEALVMAHRENVHSAMFAWLLRTPELPLGVRFRILEVLAGAFDVVPNVMTTTTEWKNLDIFVELEDAAGRTTAIAIEHKIKAREDDRQLGTYDERLSQCGIPVLAKIFLTFLGDDPRGGRQWQARSYVDLLRALEAGQAQAVNDRYLADYTSLVRRLVVARRLTVEVPAYARFIFGEDPLPDDRTVDVFARYVERCRLRVTLQRAWLGKIVPRPTVGSWSYKTDETNGAALLDIARRTSRNGAQVRYGLQLQNWQLKAFAHPCPYERGPSRAQQLAVDTMLEEMQRALRLTDVRPSAARGRGFRSIAIVNLRGDIARYDLTRWAEECASRLPALAPLAVAA